VGSGRGGRFLRNQAALLIQKEHYGNNQLVETALVVTAMVFVLWSESLTVFEDPKPPNQVRVVACFSGLGLRLRSNAGLTF